MPLAELSTDALLDPAREFDAELASLKGSLAAPDFWHPHSNAADGLGILTALRGECRDLGRICGDGSVGVFGGNDGDLAFFLEAQGLHPSIVDDAATNYNRLAGAYRLKDALRSGVEIRDVDLDGTPYVTGWYDLVFFLDRLFHYKNPYGALERLAQRARYCLLSTRVMRALPEKAFGVREYPMAYLLDAHESGGDSTCTWVFTETGLRRLALRAGWSVVEYASAGNLIDSDPVSGDGVERAFVLLRSGLYG
ncbi:MAG TPA: hypothetical protein VMF61_17220 [Candidatus Acidoferrales bacterium]|nr:hypothetical protein [Candidatus Acidoferrales bacterium]